MSKDLKKTESNITSEDLLEWDYPITEYIKNLADISAIEVYNHDPELLHDTVTQGPDHTKQPLEKEPSYLEVGTTRLKDTGKRTVFETGSQKEIVDGRGRYDLIPLEALGNLYERNGTMLDYMVSQVLFSFHRAVIAESASQKIEHLYKALLEFVNYIKEESTYRNLFFYTQELSKLYEAGAVKYAARDWEKGRPMEVFINSALRHFFQFLNDERDEQHDVAFIWNTLSLIDTLRRLPSTAYTLKEIKE